MFTSSSCLAALHLLTFSRNFFVAASSSPESWSSGLPPGTQSSAILSQSGVSQGVRLIRDLLRRHRTEVSVTGLGSVCRTTGRRHLVFLPLINTQPGLTVGPGHSDCLTISPLLLTHWFSSSLLFRPEPASQGNHSNYLPETPAQPDHQQVSIHSMTISLTAQPRHSLAQSYRQIWKPNEYSFCRQ